MELRSYNLVTININNITNQTKLDALNSFLRLNEIDVFFLQEVENSNLQFPEYEIFFNIDNRRRGVAIGLKHNVDYSTVENSLDGRLLLVRLKNGITLCNVYAPSGTQNQKSREDFFNYTCAHYLRRHGWTNHFWGRFQFYCQ